MSDSSADISHFCGMSWEFERKLDSQNRFAVPQEWRSENADGIFILIPGKDATLQLYTSSVFDERIMSKLKKLSPGNPDDLRKLRQLGSQIQKCECDKQGRIQISQKLMNVAKLGERLALIGSGDFGQIMDADRWEAEKKLQEGSGDDFLDILG